MTKKTDTKSPLVRQHIEKVVLQYRNGKVKNYNLYKKGIGFPALTCKGTVLPYWYFSNTLGAKLKRVLNGITKVTVGKINTSVSEYYTLLFAELNKLLEQDKWWYDSYSERTARLWERVSKLYREVQEEYLDDLEIPELVQHFYNHMRPAKPFFDWSKN